MTTSRDGGGEGLLKTCRREARGRDLDISGSPEWMCLD